MQLFPAQVPCLLPTFPAILRRRSLAGDHRHEAAWAITMINRDAGITHSTQITGAGLEIVTLGQRMLVVLLLVAPLLMAQADPRYLAAVLDREIQPSPAVEFQLREYLTARIPKLTVPSDAAEWQTQAGRIRRHLLEDVIFHGWPRGWVDAPLQAEDLGPIEVPPGHGYRMRKIRYEIVPGFQTTAILYEPEILNGKVPAVLNVNGHVGPVGKAVEYKQKRCINQARRGMLALNVEWMGFGELASPENAHDFAAHLDLVGANGVGLFYLAMRKGLDYLYIHPHTDQQRIGVTGLSGGGWQTIVLSALDERVAVSIPVAGYSSLEANIVHIEDTGEIEEDATDFRAGQDYTHLTAMRAPRPTLLIYNAEDDCCFRAPLVKPTIYDAIRPFFRLFDKAEVFAWHENLDPGTHNYQLDNRLQSYAFFSEYFNLASLPGEIPADREVRGSEELAVGLPKNNLTILGLARKLAEGVHHPSPVDRSRLRSVVRYKALAVTQPWMVDNTKNKGMETRSYRFGMSDGLSATGVWAKAMATPANAPITILLHDKGRKELKDELCDRVNRGEQVLALDLLFTGDAAPRQPAPYTYALLLASVGERPIGLEAGQLAAITKWLRDGSGAGPARLETDGMRSQLTGLVAAALEPGLFSDVDVSHGITSLRRLLDEPIKYRDAPDIFCLDLYRDFDVDTLSKVR
jgi:dienelactone hydrolase